MPARRRRSVFAAAGAAAAVAAAVAALAGCGTGGPRFGGDLTNGKQLYVAKCGQCHTMADAGTRSVIGPNLDDAFGPAYEQGFRESGVQQVVLDQIRLAEPPMPRNLVTGDDAADVSAYVAECAGKKCSVIVPPPAAQGGGGQGTGGGGEGEGLFTSLGCQSCHTLDGTESVGPTIMGLAGSTEMLTNGQQVMVDDAYLLESILDPDKLIAEGYAPGVMSAAIKPGAVSMADARALVEFMKMRK